MRGTGRILIMDDEDLVRDVHRMSLTNLGYDVICAHEGKEAVIRLREVDSKVKAIVSSGYFHDPIMAHFKEYSFCGVVSKPYSLRMLSETVHAVIAGDTA